MNLVRPMTLAAAALALTAATVTEARQPDSARPPALVLSHSARALAPGEAVLLTFKAAAGPIAEVHGTAFGQPFSAYQGAAPDTWHALVGIDLATKPGRYTVNADARLRDGSSALARATLDVGPKSFPTRRLTVPPEFVTPPPSEQARIEREQQLLAKVFASLTPTRLWDGGFARPVDGAVISAYGSRSVYNGQARAPHRGIDLRGATGTPVSAPAGGTVVLAADLYFSGSTVILDHGLGVFSLLCHLSRIDARPGVSANRGDLVGAIGATGRVTGPHLHWTLRIGAASVDPLSVLDIAGARQ